MTGVVGLLIKDGGGTFLGRPFVVSTSAGSSFSSVGLLVQQVLMAHLVLPLVAQMVLRLFLLP